MIAIKFYSDLFHGIGDTIRFLGIDYTPMKNSSKSGTCVKGISTTVSPSRVIVLARIGNWVPKIVNCKIFGRPKF